MSSNTDLPQDSTTAQGRWLKPLAAERDTRIAIYADVITPGPLDVQAG